MGPRLVGGADRWRTVGPRLGRGMWRVTVVLLSAALGPVAASPLAQFVADYSEYRGVSVVNLYASRSSDKLSTRQLADVSMHLSWRRDRYVNLRFLPMSPSHLHDFLTRRTGLTENVILSDDSESADFLDMVHNNGFLTEDFSWFSISDGSRVRSRMSTKYLPVNSQLIIGEVSQHPGPGNITVNLLEMYRLHQDLPMKEVTLGRWQSGYGMTSWVNGSIYERRQDWGGLELHITTISSPPFTEYYPPPNADVGGYFGEIWKQLAIDLKFTYRLTYSIDGHWGNMLANNSWTGMVGMLDRKEVEVAVCDLSILEARSSVIDYSIGLQHFRLRMFIKKPSALDVNWNTYLDVFNTPLWLTLVITVVLGSTTIAGMYCVERRVGIRAVKEGNFSWRDSLLHFYAALCQQGAEDLPDGLGTRFFFWLFYICMVTIFAAYAAMLVSFLAVQTLVLPFEDLDGLLADGTYQMGIMRGGVVFDYFKLSKNPTLAAVYERHAVGITSKKEGYRRVEAEKFVFMDLYELAILNTRCNIIDIKKDYFTHMAGFGFPKGSPYRTFIDFQLSRLNEMGVLSQILLRWWHPARSCESDGLEIIGLPAVFSAFVLLGGGIVLGVVVLLLECCWHLPCWQHSDRAPRRASARPSTAEPPTDPPQQHPNTSDLTRPCLVEVKMRMELKNSHEPLLPMLR